MTVQGCSMAHIECELCSTATPELERHDGETDDELRKRLDVDAVARGWLLFRGKFTGREFLTIYPEDVTDGELMHVCPRCRRNTYSAVMPHKSVS